METPRKIQVLFHPSTLGHGFAMVTCSGYPLRWHSHGPYSSAPAGRLRGEKCGWPAVAVMPQDYGASWGVYQPQNKDIMRVQWDYVTNNKYELG